MRKFGLEVLGLLTWSMLALVSAQAGDFFKHVSSDENEDVVFGLENASQKAWQDWFDELKKTRKKILEQSQFNDSAYYDERVSWSASSFRQYFLFMYDQAFYDRAQAKYKTAAWLRSLRENFGEIDSVLLWHAYPQLGFDLRTQFDFYEQMPGGLAALRQEVVDILHAEGVRVFLDYNPWDDSPLNAKKMASVVQALDADGLMLDTLSVVPKDLKKALDQLKKPIILAPERRPKFHDLSQLLQSWAQWSETGDFARPAIFLSKWLVPRHQTYTIRRWDTNRRKDILFSFFNASGLLIWDNVFGVWNPYSKSDRLLIKQTGFLLKKFARFFSDGNLLALRPTGVSGLDLNTWQMPDGRQFSILLNRNPFAVEYAVPFDLGKSFWQTTQSDHKLRIEPYSVEALFSAQHNEEFDFLLAEFTEIEKKHDREQFYDERLTPEPVRLESSIVQKKKNDFDYDQFSFISSANFKKLNLFVSHQRRESGCFDRENLWGWYFKDQITHELHVPSENYFLKKTAVTNAEYLDFLSRSGYWPKNDDARFLEHLNQYRVNKIFYPEKIPRAVLELPVTFVSLEDARAYAEFYGQMLPTEEQWQWAAQGRDQQEVYPAGKAQLAYGSLIAARKDSHPTRDGILNLSGNAWEWTESERSDGHNRFAILRGGVFLNAPESSDALEWMIERGAHPNSFHAKYFLMGEKLERSEAISFRTAFPLKVN